MRIAVITTTIPSRSALLEECIASVDAQTLQPVEHLIGVDADYTERNGMVANRLAERAGCEWLATLADDDLMLPHHLETLANHADDADIIYSWCEVQGRGTWNPNLAHVDLDNLHIPATALIRKKMWEKVKGWPDVVRMEDNGFWNRCRDEGARFVVVPEVTWVYRFHGANKSLLPDRTNFREAYAL